MNNHPYVIPYLDPIILPKGTHIGNEYPRHSIRYSRGGTQGNK